AFYSAIQLPDYSITQLLDSIVRGVMKTWIVFVIALIAGVWDSMPAQPQSLRIFIRSGPKTHGPGQHDYPRFLTDWTKLLTDRGAKVNGAPRFPTAAELADTDVMIIYKGDAGMVAPEERAILAAYLKRGGGLVTLHDGMCSDDPDWFATIVGGAKKHGETNFSAGKVRFHFVDASHPITKGVPDFEIDD